VIHVLYRRGFGFGRMFGLLFLFRHPVVLVVVIAVVALAVYLYRRRR
jgi:hypothetical protein